LPGQTKVLFYHDEETSGQKRTEQVNFMVIINFMVSLKNIEERTEQKK